MGAAALCEGASLGTLVGHVLEFDPRYAIQGYYSICDTCVHVTLLNFCIVPCGRVLIEWSSYLLCFTL